MSSIFEEGPKWFNDSETLLDFNSIPTPEHAKSYWQGEDRVVVSPETLLRPVLHRTTANIPLSIPGSNWKWIFMTIVVLIILLLITIFWWF
jgi:hypothetical protein